MQKSAACSSAYPIFYPPENQLVPTQRAYPAYATLQNTHDQRTQHIMILLNHALPSFQPKFIISRKRQVQSGLFICFGYIDKTGIIFKNPVMDAYWAGPPHCTIVPTKSVSMVNIPMIAPNTNINI